MGKAKILNIEDDVALQSIVCEYLRMIDYDVVSAFDGEEGLRKAIEEHPDLILLDLMMPKLDGYSMLVELKSRKDLADIPVIVVTALGGKKEACLSAGANLYLIKPVGLKGLTAEIEDLIGGEKNE